jgi:hypothetical protein
MMTDQLHYNDLKSHICVDMIIVKQCLSRTVKKNKGKKNIVVSKITWLIFKWKISIKVD